MNTTVFLLLLCILNAHCGYQGDFHRSFSGFSGQQRGGYNYGQINSGVKSQVFAKLQTSSNAASGCGHVAINGLVGNGATNNGAWSASQAYSNVGGGFVNMAQNTEQFPPYSKSQAENVQTNGRTNEGYNSGSYALQGQKSAQKAKSIDSGFVTFVGFEHSGGQKVESQGNEFLNSQGRENQEKSNIIVGGQRQKAAYEFERNSGHDHGSQSSKGFNLGIKSNNVNTQFNNNRQDITGHVQKYTHVRGDGGSNYQAEIQSEGLKADLISGQSAGAGGSSIIKSSSKDQESLSSSSGASGHEELQSSLSGALGIVSQGLQGSQNQPCDSCQKGSYALSKAKSHNGPAIAVSIG